jgi:hypothetical protein
LPVSDRLQTFTNAGDQGFPDDVEHDRVAIRHGDNQRLERKILLEIGLDAWRRPFEFEIAISVHQKRFHDDSRSRSCA